MKSEIKQELKTLKEWIEEKIAKIKTNPLDSGLAEVMLTATNPLTPEAQSHFARVHQEFTVIASILMEMEEFHEALVPPLKATGQPLFQRIMPITRVAELIYKSSTSGSGFLLEQILVNVSPALLRQTMPDPFGTLPQPEALEDSGEKLKDKGEK